MKGLKIRELVEGELYQCRLSGDSVLIIESREKQVSKEDRPRVGFDSYWSVKGVKWNTITGMYVDVLPYDFQLKAIDNG